MMWHCLVVVGMMGLMLGVGGNTAPPSLYSCIDWECEEWISQGKTLQRYVGKSDKHLSFQKNQDILILSKPVDKTQLDWVGKVGSKVGLVPREMVKEEKISKTSTKFKLDLQEIFDLVGIADADEADDEEEDTEDGDDDENNSSESDGVEIEDVELDNSGEIGNEINVPKFTKDPAKDSVAAAAFDTKALPPISEVPGNVVDPTTVLDPNLVTQTTTAFDGYQQQSTDVPFEASLLQNFHPAPAGLPSEDESIVAMEEKLTSHGHPEEVALSSGAGESISMEPEDIMPDLVTFTPNSVAESVSSVTLHPSTDTVLQGGASSTILDEYYLKETPKTPEPPQQSPSIAVEDQITPRIPDTVVLDTVTTIISSHIGSMSPEEPHPVMEQSEAITASKVEVPKEAVSTPAEKETQFTLQYVEEKTREPLNDNSSISSEYAKEIREESREEYMGSGEDLTLENGAVVSPEKVESLQPYKLTGIETVDKVEIPSDPSENDLAEPHVEAPTANESAESITSNDQSQAQSETATTGESLPLEQIEKERSVLERNDDISITDQQQGANVSFDKPSEHSLPAVEEDAGAPSSEPNEVVNIDVEREASVVPADDLVQVDVQKEIPLDSISESAATPPLTDHEEIESTLEQATEPTPPSILEAEVPSEGTEQKVEEETLIVSAHSDNATLVQDILKEGKETETVTPPDSEPAEVKETEYQGGSPPQGEEEEVVIPEASDKLEDANPHVNADTTSNEADVASIEADVAPIEADVTPNESDVTPSESGVTPNESDVTPNESDVNPNESNINPNEDVIANEVNTLHNEADPPIDENTPADISTEEMSNTAPVSSDTEGDSTQETEIDKIVDPVPQDVDSVPPPPATSDIISDAQEGVQSETYGASDYNVNEPNIPVSDGGDNMIPTQEDSSAVSEPSSIPDVETPVVEPDPKLGDVQSPTEEPHSDDHADGHDHHHHHDHGHRHHHPRNRHRYGKSSLNESSPTSSSIILVIKHLSSTLLGFLPEALQDTILDVDDALVFTGIIALTLVSICVPYIFIEGYMSVRPLKKKVVELNKSLWKVSAAYETQQEEFEIFKRKAIAHDEFKQKSEQSENDVMILKTLEKKHREQILGLRTQLKTQSKEAVEIRAMIEKTLQDKKTVEGESTKFQVAAKNATEALTKAREELMSFQTHAKSTALQLGMSSKATEVLTSKIALLQLENEELKNQIEFEAEKRKAVVEELARMEESKGEIERELSETRRTSTQKSDELEGLNNEIYRLESELSTIKETLGEDSPLLEVAEVQAKAEFNEKEASSLRTRLECVCADNERLRSREEEKDKELEDMRMERETTTNRLQVLEGYFKEREEELLKTVETLQQKESVRDKGKDELINMIDEKEEDIAKLNETVEGLKEELEERKVQHRNEIRTLESKGHENWLSLCQAERKSQDARKEAELLRQRLTAFVKEKERLEQEEEDEDDDDSGGDGLSGQLPLLFPSVIPHELVPPPILDLDDGIDDDDDVSAGPPSYFGLGDFVPPPPLPDDEEEDYDDGVGSRVVGHRRRPPPLGGTRMSPSFSDLTDDEDEHNNNIRSRPLHRRREEEGCTDGSSGSGSPPIQGGGWMNIPQPGGSHRGRNAGGIRNTSASSSNRATSTPNQTGANL